MTADFSTTAAGWTPSVPATLVDPWLRRLLSAIVTAMTGVVATVAVLAFVASFGAIHHFALRSGGIAPTYAWMIPLFVDSFVFVGACGDLWCALTRTEADRGSGWEQATVWAPKLLLIAAAAASYGLNIAHAPASSAARTVAALPPTALVVTEVVLMLIVRRAAAYRTLRLTVQHLGPGQSQSGDIEGAGAVRDLRAETGRLVDTWQARGRQLTGTDLARQLGTSPRHARRLLAAHRATASTTNRQPSHKDEVR